MVELGHGRTWSNFFLVELGRTPCKKIKFDQGFFLMVELKKKLFYEKMVEVGRTFFWSNLVELNFGRTWSNFILVELGRTLLVLIKFLNLIRFLLIHTLWLNLYTKKTPSGEKFCFYYTILKKPLVGKILFLFHIILK